MTDRTFDVRVLGAGSGGRACALPAAELGMPVGLTLNREAHADDVAPLIHAHPTQNEALGEAHLALAGTPLNAHA